MNVVRGVEASTPRGLARLGAETACAAALGVEVLGSVAMWAPVPLAWFWIGARVYDATHSLAACGGTAMLGFIFTVVFLMKALVGLDNVWIALRQKAGHDQRQGVLTQIVVASAAFGILGFMLWFYVLGRAFLIPFMPTTGGP